jgi:hypothetical protein
MKDSKVEALVWYSSLRTVCLLSNLTPHQQIEEIFMERVKNEPHNNSMVYPFINNLMD